MPCENAAQSNDYFEFIGEYSGEEGSNVVSSLEPSSLR